VYAGTVDRRDTIRTSATSPLKYQVVKRVAHQRRAALLMPQSSLILILKWKECSLFEMQEDSDDDGSLPDLQSISDSSEGSDAGDYSDGDDDWFSEVDEDDM
jgi:hypothetical protein